MEIENAFLRYPRASASHFVCIFVLSLHTLYASGMLRREGGGGGKGGIEIEIVRKTPFISKK